MGMVSADVTAACGAYFDVQIQVGHVCGQIVEDPARQQMDHDRELTRCTATAALPQSGITAASLNACVAKYQALKCDDPLPNCDFHGGLADGMRCAAPQQCASSVCRETFDIDAGVDTGCGVCAPKIPTGMPCDALDVCADDNATCVGLTTTTAGTCTLRAAEGGDCSAARCGGNLLCVQGKCAAPKAMNDTCIANAQCSSGLSCVMGKCNTPIATGSDCPDGKGCAADSACDPATKKCVKVAFAGSNASCNPPLVVCDVGPCLFQSVDAGSGTCARILGDGMQCSLTSRTLTCDAFSACVNSKCTLTPLTSCGSH
jgi:hypothetical protein